jgi:hypothetical protein
VRVQADGLHVAHGWPHLLRDADEDADDGDERDRRRGQHRRLHDVVPQRLHGKHAVLLRVLVRRAMMKDQFIS